jgi:protein-histidine pros-kinase
MLEYGQAVRNYTIEEITPELEHHSEDKFIPQTVPSYAAHTTIGKLRQYFPEYTYREVALNPTNQADRGNAWEVGVIQAFRDNPDRKQSSGKHTAEDSLHYYLAKPITITDPACLRCHGDPSIAPANMVRIYGSGNGFGWKMNETVGARIVTVPAGLTFQTARNNLISMLASLACIFLLTYVVFNYMFRRYVTRPLEAVTQATEDASLDRAPANTGTEQYVGQIMTLEKAIGRLQRSLKKAISMIEKTG